MTPMLHLPPLYPITDAEASGTLAAQVRRLGDAGFPLVQFRGKGRPADALMDDLRETLLASEAAGGWPQIVVNDRADLAVLAAQEGLLPWGLHLGQQDLPPSEARQLPGLDDVHLGTSTHDPHEWTTVDRACDHAGLGPVRGTVSKRDHAQPIGFEGLTHGCELLRAQGLAPVAIGGLAPEDLSRAFSAGAESVAMVGAVRDASDPRALLWDAQVQRCRVRPLWDAARGLVLVGPSGAGKSTLAQRLGARSGRPVWDLDHCVAQQADASIAAIFAEHGEAGFRQWEVQVLKPLLEQPCIIALGGGAWESQELREAVLASGFQVLWLAERPEGAFQRVAQDPGRPLSATREVFLARHRVRMRRWLGLPCLLPLGRSAEILAELIHP